MALPKSVLGRRIGSLGKIPGKKGIEVDIVRGLDLSLAAPGLSDQLDQSCFPSGV